MNRRCIEHFKERETKKKDIPRCKAPTTMRSEGSDTCGFKLMERELTMEQSYHCSKAHNLRMRKQQI